MHIKTIKASGKFFRVNKSTVEVSTDNKTWTASLSKPVNDIISDDGIRIIAAGNGGKIYTTTDGLEWEEHDSGVSGNIRSLHYTNSVFFAETTRLASNWVTSTVYTKKIADITSKDGINWQEIDIKKSLHTGNHNITYNGTHYISFYSGKEIYQSTDGINWENTYINDYQVRDLQMSTQGENDIHTVIAGENARIYVVEKDSTPSYTWPWIGTTRAFGFGSDFHTLSSLAHGKGMWIAAGHDLIIGQEAATPTSTPASGDSPTGNQTPDKAVAGDTNQQASGSSGGGALGIPTFLFLTILSLPGRKTRCLTDNKP
jgi:hypothetical protein